MFKIETFKDPMIFYNDIKVRRDEVHITSIPTLAMHIKTLGNREVLWNVWIYHHFYKAIYPKWMKVTTVLEHKRVVRELIKEHKDEWGKHTGTLLKQVGLISQSFRSMMELGFGLIQPSDKQSELEQYHVKLYNYFIELPELQGYKQELGKELTKQELDLCLNKYNLRYQKEERAGFPPINRIYIYSMDYMDVGRIAFFEKLSLAGYEVIFRIPYSEAYPHIHECWRKVYECLVPKEEWIDLQPELQECTSPLKAFLEGRQVDELPKSKIYYHEMDEPILFKNYLKENPLDRKVQEYVACQDSLLNEYFRDEIHKYSQVNHFYETPLGRFINKLYTLKIDEEHIYMDYETFMTMMTAGVIVINGTNEAMISGRRAQSLLSELKTYMDGVKTLEEILDRLESYTMLSVMSREFEDQGRSKAERNRVKRYLQNPFRAFGFVYNGGYSVTLNQFIDLARKLQEKIRELIVDHSPITNMASHVEVLKSLIIESGILESISDIEEIETQVMIRTYQRFFGILNKQLAATKIYDLEDMNEYIAVRTSMESIDEADGKVILIKGIEHILGMCVNGVQNVYLCDLSTLNMNAYVNNRMASHMLFTMDELQQYTKQIIDNSMADSINKVIDLCKMTMNQTQNFIKYSMVSLLTYYRGNLHLGWIKNMNVYDTPWYLLDIIKSLYHIEKVESVLDIDTEFIIQEEDRVSEVEVSVDQLYDQVSPLAWKDLEICGKKFYYSNLLNHYPIYREDFTQRQLFAHLCKMLEATLYGKENVKKYIYPLFPQWNETLKQNMIDIQQSKAIKKYLSYDNVEFPEDMLGVQCLNRYKQNLKDIGSVKKHEILQEWLDDSKEVIKATPGIHCDRCPHQLLCREGELAIEREY